MILLTNDRLRGTRRIVAIALRDAGVILPRLRDASGGLEGRFTDCGTLTRPEERHIKKQEVEYEQRYGFGRGYR